MLFSSVRRKCFVLLGLLFTGVLFLTVACSSDAPEGRKAEKIVFADADWESIKFHNEVARFIIENGYGYQTDTLPGTTVVTFEGLRRGDIDVYMEVWTDNLEFYDEAINNGDILEASLNYDDNRQGFYVPTYLIKGDPAKGIEAVAPDLKSIADLPKYWEVFRDSEDKNKGRIYGAIPDWAADEIISQKVKNYGLEETYNLFRPGSGTALATSIVKAMEKGEPWLGYYWEPEWITGKYDLTLLEEPAYEKEKWDNGYTCAFPTVPVMICTNKDLPQKAPEVMEFLKKYQTSTDITSQGLAYMQENNVGAAEGAKWFLQNNQELWTQWVSADVVKKVEEAF